MRGGGFLIALGAYAVAAAVLFCRTDLLAGTGYLGWGGDPLLYIWMFHFLPSAIAHLQNPFILKAAWAPVGLNITQATTTPLLAIIAWPITAFVGPVVAFNIVSMASPALAAASGFLFARHYTKIWGAAFVAGWIFGFSTAVFAPMQGHLQTDFVAFVPLAFLAINQRIAGELSRLKFFTLLVVLLVAQFLTSLETFVTEAIFIFIFAIVTEISQPDGVARLLRMRADNIVVALISVYAGVGIAVSPFLYVFFSNYSQMPSELQNGGSFAIDLLNFIIPTPVTWLGGGLALPIASQFKGNFAEADGYIGAPLLVLAMFAAWRAKGDRRSWPLLAMLCCGLSFVLGPRLHIMGHSTVKLPWSLMEHLPFLKNALPARLMVFAMLGIAALCARLIDQLEHRRGILLIAFSGAIACTLPATFVHPNWWNSPVPTEKFFSAGRYQNIIRKDDTVLFLPFSATSGNAMFWQTETNGYFRMIDGYGNFVPMQLGVWPAAGMLEAGMPDRDFAQQFNLFARANHIDDVIVPASILPIWRAAIESGGWHEQTDGDLAVFTASSQAPSATSLPFAKERAMGLNGLPYWGNPPGN